MTQEEKDLLLKDLCARLSYGVKAAFFDIEDECENFDIVEYIDVSNKEHEIGIGQYCLSIDKIKPYLFHLSSMTEEEWKEYQTLKMTDWVKGDINGVFINAGTITDWLNAHYFDYRGLIEKGLAIDCTNLNIY